ncbi:MAG: aminotransferase class V-fold PLP-dependent enzyme, partial [Lacipirellulaceae bacterium]
DLGVTALNCAAHKFHGPTGIGVLVVKHGVSLDPGLFGGFQQAGLRPGTESVPLAVGMATALRLAKENLHDNYERLRTLQERFEQALRTGQVPGETPQPGIPVKTVGDLKQRVPHISNLIFPDVDRQALVMALDLAGVAISTGSACASGSSKPSPTLLAMGLSEEEISGSIRVSFSALTTRDEIDGAARRILNVVNGLRQGI